MIYSPAIIKELIMWNPDGNFDRVSALGMVMWHDATMQSHTIKREKEVKTFLDNSYFAKMGVHKRQKTPLDWGKSFE